MIVNKLHCSKFGFHKLNQVDRYLLNNRSLQYTLRLLAIFVAALVSLYHMPKVVYAVDPVFTESSQEFPIAQSNDVALGDLDNDGDLDAVIVNDNEKNQVWLNQGGSQDGVPGTYVELSDALGNTLGDSRSVALGDLDGDGDLDVVVGVYGSGGHVWINNGVTKAIIEGTTSTLSFTPGQILGAGMVIEIALGDLTDDGYFDVYIANERIDEVWQNQGNGTFLPVENAIRPEEADLKSTGVALGYINDDRFIDAYEVYEINSIENPGHKVWLNDGTGRFDDADSSNTWKLGSCTSFSQLLNFIFIKFYFGYDDCEVGSAVSLADLDGDGDLDAFVANKNRLFRSYLFRNPPSPLPPLPPLTSFPTSQSQVWLNGGAGNSSTSFVRGSRGIGNASSQDIALGDLNGDSSIDSFVANDVLNSQQSGNLPWLNQSQGIFVQAGQPLGSSNARGVALGDLDGDADLDAFVANFGQPSKIWINNSGGVFQPSVRLLGSDETSDVAVADLDGDQYLDIFFANYNAPNSIWLNRKNGEFQQVHGATNTPALSRGVALAQIDGKSGLDAVIAREGANVILFNIEVDTNSDGNKRVTFQEQSLGIARNSTDVALGDLDCDNDIDIFITNYEQPHEIWFNETDDSGAIVWKFKQLDNNSKSRAVALGDLEANLETTCGLDVFIANEFDVPNSIWLNHRGDFVKFELPEEESNNPQDSVNVAIADLDDDRDLDILVANYGQAYRIWLNQGMSKDGNLLPFDIRDETLGEGVLSYSVALQDLNDDNEPDLFVAGWNGSNLVWSNNRKQGTAEGIFRGFSDSGQSLQTFPSRAVATGFLDEKLATSYGGGIGSNGAIDTICEPDSVTGRKCTRDAVVASINGNSIWLNQLDNTTNDPSAIFKLGGGQGLGDSDSRAVALGDLDNDGDLDVFVANGGSDPNEIWFNQESLITSHSAGFDEAYKMTLGTESSNAVAVGDFNGDRVLDVFLANDGADKLLLNRGVSQLPPFVEAIVENNQSYISSDVALGDLDGDGDLDALVATKNGPNLVWFNQQEQDESSVRFKICGLVECSDSDFGARIESRGVALGDIDKDGDLDAIFANSGKNELWLNNSDGTFVKDLKFESSSDVADSYDVLLGDLDSDGDLDIFVVNLSGQPNRIWYNQGGQKQGGLGSFQLGQSLNNYSQVPAAALGDLDGDKDLDIIAADRVWLNQGYAQGGVRGVFQIVGLEEFKSSSNENSQGIALGDLDRDGDLDLFVANRGQGDGGGANQVYLASVGGETRHQIVVKQPNGMPSANFFSTGIILSDTVTVNYSLIHPDNQPIGELVLYYSLDGGGHWLEVSKEALSGLPTTGLVQVKASAVGEEGTLRWDINKSKIFGFTDSMVLRIEARFQPPPAEVGTYKYFNKIPGPFIWPSVASTTYPFRVRGVQIQVVDQTGKGVPDAVVYHRKVNELVAQRLPRDVKLTTDANGYLRGRGTIEENDEIVALQPISTSAHLTFTDQISLYFTSAQPMATGLVMTKTVLSKGVQLLTTTEKNKLLVFDLSVSLEWDARADSTYLNQLEQDIKRTSEILFDLTNGQAALGTVTLYQAKEHWIDADIQVYARNDVRPNANLGGIVKGAISETVLITPGLPITRVVSNAIVPGQIRMGASWNRFGNPDGTVGEDWPRALAHEIGHYAFFLLDNYLGVTQDALLKETECQGSVMTNSYREDYSDYLDFPELAENAAYKWQDACNETLAAYTTGRSDWETIRTFYHSLDLDSNINVVSEGPSKLPLDVTKVIPVPPVVPTSTLASMFVNLADADNNNASLSFRSGEAHAYLIKKNDLGTLLDDVIIPVGTPNGPLIQARGATEHDRFCVFANAQQDARIGCIEDLSSYTTTLSLTQVPDWLPQIVVRTVSSTTLTISVTQSVPSNQLYVQVYPSAVLTGPLEALTGAMVPLSKLDVTGATVFSTTLSFKSPIVNGYVRIWEPESIREAIVPFFVSVSWNGDKFGFFGGDKFGFFGGDKFGFFGANLSSWSAPVSSSDGQIAIFNTQDILAGNVAATLQRLTVPPPIPSWLIPVGQVYRYSTSESSKGKLVLLFQYLERELPDVLEKHLRIYYSPDDGKTWERLENTFIDPVRNLASAEMRKDKELNVLDGLYALMATIETPNLYSGWNQFSYPDTNRRVVNTAIASIANNYMAVAQQVTKGEDGNPVPAQWRLYDPRVAHEHPEFATLVNGLQTMQPLESYWVYVVTDTVPYIGVPVADNTQQIRASGITELPPATFYGWVTPVPEIGFNPQPGSEIVAMIDESICGRSVILERGPDPEYYVELPYKVYLPVVGGSNAAPKLYYKIQVRADTGEGCGVFGHDVTFYVDGRKLENNHPWGNSQACFHDLGVPQAESLPTACFRAPAPDLSVDSVTVLDNDVRVVVKNVGTAEVPAGAGFWVDAYINPDPNHLPERVNDIWQNFTNRGIAWGLVDLSEPIDPGDTLTLTVGSQYFVPAESNIAGGWSSANTQIYVQVDSAHAHTKYGGVLESHEINSGPYDNCHPANNFGEPLTIICTAGTVSERSVEAIVPVSNVGLPPRR